MLKFCVKHRTTPLVGYTPCPSCEIEMYIKENKQLKETINELLGLEYSTNLCQEGVITKCYCKKCVRKRAANVIK